MNIPEFLKLSEKSASSGHNPGPSPLYACRVIKIRGRKRGGTWTGPDSEEN